MRIAQVAPLVETVPPARYGGTERVVSYLTEELVRLGHDVTLFASGDSVTGARLVPVVPRALWQDPSCRETLPHHERLMERVFADVTRFDVNDVQALEIFSGLLGAALSFELCRMPELFCGFARAPGEGPVMHPVACAPQAWAAGSVLLLVQTSLGLDVDAVEGRVVLRRPRLPVELTEIRIHDLEVAGSSLDLAVSQDGDDVAVKVLRRDGEAQVVVIE